jgi:hypothetical protein
LAEIVWADGDGTAPMKTLSISELLTRSGSDKAKWYGGLYDVLLQPNQKVIKSLIEIGIGTPVSMAGYCSEDYRAGGSLRAWRDFLPNAQIHGLDVDPDAQVTDEPRITTYLCDTTNTPQSAAALQRMLLPADLIIDDGLHTKEAQIATLRNFYPALRAGGLYIIEDVWPENVDDILNALEQIEGGGPSFVDRSWGQCVAIVIRRPAEPN